MAPSWESTLAALERSAAADRARKGRKSAHPVAAWPAPRGPRGEDGHWLWSLAERPDSSFGSDAERQVVRAHAYAVAQLTCAREARGWSLRHLGQGVADCFPPTSQRREAQQGMPLSVLTGVMTGSIWPRFDSLSLVAQALGHRVQLAGPAPRPANVKATDLTAVEASWEAVSLLPGAWQLIVISELGSHLAATRTSKTELALRVGLRKNTVSELWTFLPPQHWASVRTLAALADHFQRRLEVVPRAQPWPAAVDEAPPWDTGRQ